MDVVRLKEMNSLNLCKGCSLLFVENTLQIDPVFASIEDEVQYRFFNIPVQPVSVSRLYFYRVSFVHISRVVGGLVYWYDSSSENTRQSEINLFENYIRRQFTDVHDPSRTIERSVFLLSFQDEFLSKDDMLEYPVIRSVFDSFVLRHGVSPSFSAYQISVGERGVSCEDEVDR
jgi:hypothetical protein